MSKIVDAVGGNTSIERNRGEYYYFFLVLILINLVVYVKIIALTDSINEINSLKLKSSELKSRLNDITKKFSESDKPSVIIVRIGDVMRVL